MGSALVKFELFDYQEVAISALTRYLRKASADRDDDPDERSAVILTAPTGAGKTIIATSVMAHHLEAGPDALAPAGSTFLWVTDDPSLNRQTRNKMVAASPELASRLVTVESGFDEEFFEAGHVYFLNVQKLASTGMLSRSRVDGRRFSLWETIRNTVERRPEGFVLVIDEAHRGMNSTATTRGSRETIISQIIGGGAHPRAAAPIIWGISATPRRFRDAMSGRVLREHSVRVEDVRASGLLKDQIVLGHTMGVDAAASSLVRFAVERIRRYDQKWADYTAETGDPRVLPVLVIQVPDRADSAALGDLVSTVLEEWPQVTGASVVHTFADHSAVSAGGLEVPWCPPEDIQDREDVRVVLCKTAITTGWDCPRAEVLLSLRVARDMDLITQVMGRMVRTPLARRVETDQDLNAVHCILPSFDQAAVDEIAQRFQVGDEETLATGTRVVVSAVELSHNRHLQPVVAPASPAPASETAELAMVTDVAPPTTASPASSSSDTTGSTSGVATGAQRPSAPRSEGAEPSPSQPEGDLLAPTPEQDLSAQQPSRSAYDVLAGLPSYTIPRRSLRRPIERLMHLAMLLSQEHDGYAIDPQAPLRVKHELLNVMDVHRSALEAAGTLAGLVERAGSARLVERTVGFADPGAALVDAESVLTLDTRGVGILMQRAANRLPEGLANDYVNRLAPGDAAVRDAMLTTIALADDDDLLTALDARASQLVAQWFRDHGSAITRLSAPEQERFDRVRRESDVPLLTTVTLPTHQTVPAEGETYPRHLLADDAGQYRVQLGPEEKHVLTTELEAGAVAWYRNRSSGRAALQIPYNKGSGVAGLSPDFIFFTRLGSTLTASIIDPHGNFLSDAVPKLKGLSAYARTHPEAFHRIQSVALVDGDYLMLNHLDTQVRQAIDAYEAPLADALFRDHGTRY